MIGIERKRVLKITIICLVLILLLCKGLSAHPHVFIVQRIKIVFDDQGLAGFNIRWDFDDMFTGMIAGDYDKNKNGVMEPAEVTDIKENAFSYLSNQDYFTFIKIDGKPFKVRFVKDFSAKLNDNRLIYEFFVPCEGLGVTLAFHKNLWSIMFKNKMPAYPIEFIDRSLFR